MATLTGKKIKDTYQGLVKTNNNGNISETNQYLTDGENTVSALSLGTENVGIGTIAPSKELEVVGDIELSGVITGTAYSTSSALSTNVNFKASQVFTKTLTTATTLTFSNFTIGQVKDLIITGDFTLNLPASVNVAAGTYDGTAINLIQVICTDSTTPVFWATISQPQ